jgi:hypothetical protein
VFKKQLIAGTVALACATSVLAAQAPASPAAQQPPAGGAAPAAPVSPAAPAATPAAPPAAQAPVAQQGSTTLTGCLYRENQIPGRTPNVAERAGVLEDYILADASMASAPSGARPGATAGATGTTGSTPSAGNMYKVERIPDDQLKTLVGKRVEVMGRIDPQGGTAAGAPTADKSPSPDRINLPEFEATSIKEVAGTCPATPAPLSK